MSDKTKKVLVGLGLILAGAAAMFGLDVAVFRPTTTEMEKVVETVTNVINTGSSIELGETDEPALVEESVVPLIDQKDIKTVESVDGGQMLTEEGKEADDITSARGAYYRTDTVEHFIEDTRNKCVIEGNIYGAQCVSLAQAFWTNYAGYGLDTCGTGAARGLWDCREKNADDSFVLITDPKNIQPGDWIITNGGTWGHVAMAVGAYNNGYIAVYGENQGGVLCELGGSQPNVINLSMSTFRGAFRPTAYIIPEPEPEAPASPDTGAATLLYAPVVLK